MNCAAQNFSPVIDLSLIAFFIICLFMLLRRAKPRPPEPSVRLRDIAARKDMYESDR